MRRSVCIISVCLAAAPGGAPATQPTSRVRQLESSSPCTMPILPNKTSASRPHAHTSCTARTVEQCPHEHERKRVVLPGVHELPHATLEILSRPPLQFTACRTPAVSAVAATKSAKPALLASPRMPAAAPAKQAERTWCYLARSSLVGLGRRYAAQRGLQRGWTSWGGDAVVVVTKQARPPATRRSTAATITWLK